mmetsp:Transcript_6143/g.9301  ORF Transcript_6143/g.9301 Transcript_6143/m.9301 type:complete len:113 (+) Transcript_6143:1231-1569(+)
MHYFIISAGQIIIKSSLATFLFDLKVAIGYGDGLVFYEISATTTTTTSTCLCCVCVYASCACDYSHTKSLSRNTSTRYSTSSLNLSCLSLVHTRKNLGGLIRKFDWLKQNEP